MIILDTSFLVAFHNRRDTHHEAARRVMGRLLAGEYGLALLPEYVFLELVTVLALRRDLATAKKVGGALLDAREVQFVPCSDFFLATFEVFRKQVGGALSFADASIVAIAKAYDIEIVATFDADLASTYGLTAA